MPAWEVELGSEEEEGLRVTLVWGDEGEGQVLHLTAQTRHWQLRFSLHPGVLHTLPGSSPGDPPGSPQIHPMEAGGHSVPPALTGAPPVLMGNLQNTIKTPEKGEPREVSKP